MTDEERLAVIEQALSRCDEAHAALMQFAEIGQGLKDLARVPYLPLSVSKAFTGRAAINDVWRALSKLKADNG